MSIVTAPGSARLLGREPELRRIGDLLSRVRRGRGGALLLAGEPGIGKTTLLGAGTAGPAGMRVVRVDGFEAESRMPFAAIQRLVQPLREFVPALPERHRRALEVTSGVAAGPPPDRFLIGLGVLGLLAAAGADTPVLCAVDDAHLLDPESLDVLAFVARRLEAEAAAVVLAARDGDDPDPRLAGIPRLGLGGLPPEAAVRLLVRSLSEPIDPAVAAQIAVATGGNPLALTDLADELSVRQLTEFSLGDDPFPVGRRLGSFYLRQVRALGADLQLWLLVAAADSTGTVDLVQEAAAKLGLPDDAGDGAEAAGLVDLAGGGLRFRHPLVRSAAYNAADGRDRRQVHRVLAEAAGSRGLVELEAWHAARGTLGLDEAVARRLELAADRAGRRGGFATRARVLTQAAALTPNGGQRYRRLVAAADAALDAGTAQLAKDLVDEVDEDALDDVSRGRLLVVRARWALCTADPSLTRAGANLMEAAGLFHGHDPLLEQTTLIRAWELSLPAGRSAEGMAWDELGRRMAAAATVREGPAAVLLEALGAHLLLPFADAVPAIRRAVGLIAELPHDELLRLGQSAASLCSALWDEAARRRCLERLAQAARDAGSLQQLDTALWTLSLTEAVAGNPRAAAGYAEQVRDLRRAIGYEAEHVVNVALLAHSGLPREQVLALAEATRAAGFGGVHSTAVHATVDQDLALSRYEEAYALLRPLVADPFLHTTPLMYPNFVEAAARIGRTVEAGAALELLEARAAATGSPWARGVAARSRALVTAEDPEPLYREAIERLREAGVAADLGRAHLLHGEWLRRAKRRRDARDALRAAAEVFASIGADAFAGRARSELAALGDVPAAPGAAGAPGLTAQEATVARLAAAGRTNAEIAATMFLSANTVDYHLRKVFQKLAISSRRQLTDRLAR